MNPFDSRIVHFVNSFARRYWILDSTVAQIAVMDLLIGAGLMTMFWLAWMEHGEESIENRESLMATLFATPFAVLFARVLALCLPYRERPLHEPLLHFQTPLTQNPDWLIHWSSFPSDHAAVSFCVATGLWIVSRRLGGWAMGYATLISLPRIYLGFHYPTDIIGGALVGMGTMFLCRAAGLRSGARWVLNYLDRRPAFLYGFLFVFSFEVAEMFNSLQRILFLGVDAFHRYPRWQWKEFAAPLLLSGVLSIVAWVIWWWKHHSVTERPVQTIQD